ncbi:hypothetical protein CVT26_010111 [Gymnopilus dilepis]|uniref:Protein kinase domain-containing protein n=1 Tax=Gymnopilus dilepis TaxID=231916 RepID=A0A409YS44_9AGAR|nr:hypothetical protein CVT26_010111 [Gymnopilus dilepis]
MSEPELYMADSNDAFDLPRWQTQVDPQPAYLYTAPQTTQRMQPYHAQAPTRQPRISQLLEQEQQLPSSLSPYSAPPQAQLSRSASLGGGPSASISATRMRRHHPPDDLEGAFNADNQHTQPIAGPRQQPQLSHSSYYSSNVAYQPPSLTTSAPVNTSTTTSPPDPYSDMYYNNGSAPQPPKRLQPGQHDVNSPSSARGGRSPLRVPNTPISNSPLDQYSHRSQYSPTTNTTGTPLNRGPTPSHISHTVATTRRSRLNLLISRLPFHLSPPTSPLRQLTTNILDTYRICNPQFRYESAHNPRRVLTKPSKPAHNDGYDNEDYDYILYVNDWLGSDDGHKYLILDILGQGTFGQVVKCQNMKTHEIVAVKVVKNKPAYFNQSMMEVTILELLNKSCDPNDEHHILRLRDSFIHRSHLCLVFELLSSNLYELIKQNQFQGLSTQLVKVFMAQLLDALTVLKEARLIHCDLKPENILLKSLQSPQIKVIDFGSACHERQTVYTYIQSRFYRSPEVLLGMSYNAAIDMWSLGCIAVELFLGLPLFPGTSEYNQLTRIIEMLGMPPNSMLESGKQTSQFFDTAAFIDFCQGLLNLNPATRWTPQQARLHPFITGEKYTKPFVPDGVNVAHQSPAVAGQDPKRPYGGLVPSQPKGQRAYTDAATYNHHLAQHQAYTAQAQAQAQSQAANNFRNPYMAPQNSQQQHSTSNYASPSDNLNSTYQQQQQQQAPPATQQPQQAQYLSNPPPAGHRQLAHQNSTGQLATGASTSQYQNHASGANMGTTHIGSNIPANPYIPSSRPRGNTINQIEAGVPPALARLQRMNQDVIGGRNALTPVLNRDDAMREWERRQAGKAAAAQPYPQLEYLQQQAELAAAQGLTNWSSQTRYPPPPSKLSHAYQPQSIMVDDDNANTARRDAVMSNVRTAARSGEGQSSVYSGTNTNIIPSPPQAYTGNASTSGNRYPANYNQNQPVQGFDSLERRTDMSNMYVPMQPEQYQSYNSAPPAATSRQIAPPAQAVPPSFYGANVIPSGQMNTTQGRNPFQLADGSQQPATGSKDARRGNGGIDAWQR